MRKNVQPISKKQRKASRFYNDVIKANLKAMQSRRILNPSSQSRLTRK